MELMQVIIRPYLTEKTYSVRNSGNKKETVVFEVNPKASKTDIKNAFFAIYQITPEAINTSNNKPAKIRTGTKNPGSTKLTKIAYITLPEGVKLAITKDEVDSANDNNERKQVNSDLSSKIKDFFTKKKSSKSHQVEEPVEEVKQEQPVEVTKVKEEPKKSTDKKVVTTYDDPDVTVETQEILVPIGENKTKKIIHKKTIIRKKVHKTIEEK